MLQLRAVDITLYDAAPLTPYELHTRHQSRNLRAKLVQTGDDDVDKVPCAASAPTGRLTRAPTRKNTLTRRSSLPPRACLTGYPDG